jgi:hypothetical protein
LGQSFIRAVAHRDAETSHQDFGDEGNDHNLQVGGLVHRSKCRAGFVQLAGSVQAALSQSTIKSRLIGTASRLVDSSN